MAIIRFLGTVLIIASMFTGSDCVSPAQCTKDTQSNPQISPHGTLIVSEQQTPGTLACISHCQDLENVLFKRPVDGENRTELDILTDPTFSTVVGRPRTTNIQGECSHSVNITWTRDEHIRAELDSATCIFIYSDGTICKMETVSIVFTDMSTPASCSNLPTISPSTVDIVQGKPSTITCSASCLDAAIEMVYFNVPNEEQGEKGTDIHRDETISPLISRVSHTLGMENNSCTETFSLNISWTQDDTIRSRLHSLVCIVVHQGGSPVCETNTCSIVFSGGAMEESYSEPTTPSANFTSSDNLPFSAALSSHSISSSALVISILTSFVAL